MLARTTSRTGPDESSARQALVVWRRDDRWWCCTRRSRPGRARSPLARQRIERAGGDPARVTVVAVTKGFGPDVVARARRLGQIDFGENYAGDLLAKRGAADDGCRWHYLGAVQRNDRAQARARGSISGRASTGWWRASGSPDARPVPGCSCRST